MPTSFATFECGERQEILTLLCLVLPLLCLFLLCILYSSFHQFKTVMWVRMFNGQIANWRIYQNYGTANFAVGVVVPHGTPPTQCIVLFQQEGGDRVPELLR